MYNIGWFSTGRDEAARELLLAVYRALAESGAAARIAFVFSNRRPGEAEASDRFFAQVEELGIELIHYSSAEHAPKLRQAGREDPGKLAAWRLSFDREVLRRIQDRPVDLIVLAGYMLIVSPEACRRYRMINLHPAAPGGPKGTWQEVIWQLIEARAEQTGVTVHLVTEELDEGPPVAYCTFPLRGGRFDALWEEFEQQVASYGLEWIKEHVGERQPLFAAIREEGVRRELPLLSRTVVELAKGKLRVDEAGRVYRDSKELPGGFDASWLI